MVQLLSYAPVAAAAFAVPQFVPQIRRLRSTGDTAGVSWAWAALTCVNNGAWTAYFGLSRYWTALVPSVSVAVLAGLLAIMLTRRVRTGSRPLLLMTAWSVLLVTAGAAGGGAGLGTLLTAGFIVQVTPPLWTAYRVARPTGVSVGTWLLIFAELACWLLFGVHESDPRLITLGAAGVIASALMLARMQYTAFGPSRWSEVHATVGSNQYNRTQVQAINTVEVAGRVPVRRRGSPVDRGRGALRCARWPGLAGLGGCHGSDRVRAGRLPTRSGGCGVGAPGGDREGAVGVRLGGGLRG